MVSSVQHRNPPNSVQMHSTEASRLVWTLRKKNDILNSTFQDGEHVRLFFHVGEVRPTSSMDASSVAMEKRLCLKSSMPTCTRPTARKCETLPSLASKPETRVFATLCKGVVPLVAHVTRSKVSFGGTPLDVGALGEVQ